MPVIMSLEEFTAMADKCRRAIRFEKFSKTTKPRRRSKTQAIIYANMLSLQKNFPRLCRDGCYRFPDYIEELRQKGETDKLPLD